MNILKGFILFAVLIVIGIWLGGDNRADMSSDGGYEPAKTVGHPLWND